MFFSKIGIQTSGVNVVCVCVCVCVRERERETVEVVNRGRNEIF